MAAMQSNFPNFPTSIPDTRRQPVASVPLLIQKLSPSRQSTLRARLRLAKEPEDAGITGGTRSLDRRLLGLNLSGARAGANAA